MRRLGFFSGKLYSTDTPIEDIKECCFIMQYKDPSERTTAFLEQKRKELKNKCTGCKGCALSNPRR